MACVAHIHHSTVLYVCMCCIRTQGAVHHENQSSTLVSGPRKSGEPITIGKSQDSLLSSIHTTRSFLVLLSSTLWMQCRQCNAMCNAERCVYGHGFFFLLCCYPLAERIAGPGNEAPTILHHPMSMIIHLPESRAVQVE